MRKNKCLLILVLLLFYNGAFSQEFPNSLTIENKGLSLIEIRNWMYAFGELSEANDNFTLEELVQKSHLINKEKPYSVYQFNNYGINKEGLATIVNFSSDCNDNNTHEIFYDYKSGLFYDEKNYDKLANYNFVRILKTHYFGEIKNGRFERIGVCNESENSTPKNELGINLEIQVYPNPFKNSFNIVINNYKDFNKIEVIEPNGKLVFEINYNKLLDENNEAAIDASVWTSGIYFLKISGDFGIKYLKIIKF